MSKSVWVITGTTRGIGRELARQISQRPGALVISINRRHADPPLDNVQEIVCDLTDAAQLKAAAGRVGELGGGSVDVLINNAGLTGADPFKFGAGEEESIGTSLRTSFDINSVTPAVLTSALLPLLRKGQMKRIMNISSGRGSLQMLERYPDVPGPLAYGMSKAAFNFFTTRLASDLRPEGFLVFSLSPALVYDGPDQRELVLRAAEGLKKLEPDAAGPTSVQDGVKLMLDVSDRLGLEDSGKNLSMWGDDHWLGEGH